MGKNQYIGKGEPTISGCSGFIFLALILGLGLGLWAGVHFAGSTIPEVAQRAVANWSEAQKNIKAGESVLESSQAGVCQKEDCQKIKEIIYLLKLQRSALLGAVTSLCPRGFRWNLNIDWKAKELVPFDQVLLFNQDTLPPPDKFRDNGGKGFIFLHWVKKGEPAIYLGKEDGYMTVLYLGDFLMRRGGLLTFKPEECFVRQRALVYREDAYD
jgi:hypothetical protein